MSDTDFETLAETDDALKAKPSGKKTLSAEKPVEEGGHQYDQRFLARVLEGALLACGGPLTLDRMLMLFDEDKRPSRQQLILSLQTLADGQHDRGFILREVASGWRFDVCDDLAPWVNRLWEEKPQKYSRALLETLALIAYRQPLTRGDIEDVRGVAVSSHIIKTLLEREWVKVIGHKDVPGRPALFATTRQFLDYFGLKNLDELPSLGELKDIGHYAQDTEPVLNNDVGDGENTMADVDVQDDPIMLDREPHVSEAVELPLDRLSEENE
ncbi:MAG: SMC-Scp complex subunit ScpB [Marinagarivorans sp.]|nr:SMC-Scp complex subunit ScpB [Marinagarivorans sp.]